MSEEYVLKVKKPNLKLKAYCVDDAMVDASCVLCLPLDEGQGTIAYDKSGKGNNGTIYGASWVDGKYGKALSFDGTGYVLINSNAVFDLSEMSVALWFNAANLSVSEIIIGKNITGSYNWQLYRLSSWSAGVLDWLHYYTKTDDSTGALLLSLTLQTNTWYHTVFIIKPNGYYEVWLNGARVRYGTVANFQSWRISTSWIKIGPAFIGLTDEIRVYNRALSETEVQRLAISPYHAKLYQPYNLKVRGVA
ncbi:MAG: LamG domain-containing protein [Candidatus Bathyarchaeia archaeon]